MAEVRKPGWWYPYIFVAGFGVVIAVNGIMAYFATSTFTGLWTQNAFDKGVAYNQNLALAEAQALMGWTVETKVAPVDGDLPRANVAISYVDRDGRPVEGLEVVATFKRPTVGGHDFEAPLSAVGSGTYGAIIDLPLKGLWDLEAVALGVTESYQHAHRFVIP